MNTTEEITSLINAIRDLTGVGICYYDLNSFFQYDKYGIKNNRGHYCDFCKKVRSLPNGREKCEESDRVLAVELARQYKRAFFYECHMGMRELVIPLERDGELLGILFIGQCRTDGDYGSEIEANARKMITDPAEILRLYNELPQISKKKLLSIGEILSQYFDTKILSHELLAPKMNDNLCSRDMAESMRSFIKQNYKSHLSTKEVAEAFHINPSYASRCFSQKYQMTITEYIMSVRVKQAKILLSTTEAPIGNIALNVGYDDVNYFSRIFKKIVGCSPLQYRMEGKKASLKKET